MAAVADGFIIYKPEWHADRSKKQKQPFLSFTTTWLEERAGVFCCCGVRFSYHTQYRPTKAADQTRGDYISFSNARGKPRNFHYIQLQVFLPGWCTQYSRNRPSPCDIFCVLLQKSWPQLYTYMSPNSFDSRKYAFYTWYALLHLLLVSLRGVQTCRYLFLFVGRRLPVHHQTKEGVKARTTNKVDPGWGELTTNLGNGGAMSFIKAILENRPGKHSARGKRVRGLSSWWMFVHVLVATTANASAVKAGQGEREPNSFRALEAGVGPEARWGLRDAGCGRPQKVLPPAVTWHVHDCFEKC